MTRTFDPWVGSKYWSDGFNGVRVLILGESHYGEPGTEKSVLTSEVVKEWAQQKRFRFFTVTQKLVSGLESNSWVSNEQRKEFWELVAFYNFIQTFPGSEPRYRPTQKMWSEAASPFLSTLEDLSPHVLVVLGYELQLHMPETPKKILVCSVQHPSSRGFRYEHWQPVVRSTIRAALENIAQQGAPGNAKKRRA